VSLAGQSLTHRTVKVIAVNLSPRRKKAKCTGEQPICSLCARLRQQCIYAEERRRPPPEESSRPIDPEARSSHVLVIISMGSHVFMQLLTLQQEDRLRSLESKVGEVLDVLG